VFFEEKRKAPRSVHKRRGLSTESRWKVSVLAGGLGHICGRGILPALHLLGSDVFDVLAMPHWWPKGSVTLP